MLRLENLSRTEKQTVNDLLEKLEKSNIQIKDTDNVSVYVNRNSEDEIFQAGMIAEKPNKKVLYYFDIAVNHIFLNKNIEKIYDKTVDAVSNIRGYFYKPRISQLI